MHSVDYKLPMTTRGFALHLRRFVEPVHRWLVARADHLIEDVARLTTGITATETQAWHDLRQERIARALESAPSTTPQTAEESHAQR